MKKIQSNTMMNNIINQPSPIGQPTGQNKNIQHRINFLTDNNDKQ